MKQNIPTKLTKRGFHQAMYGNVLVVINFEIGKKRRRVLKNSTEEIYHKWAIAQRLLIYSEKEFDTLSYQDLENGVQIMLDQEFQIDDKKFKIKILDIIYTGFHQIECSQMIDEGKKLQKIIKENK